MGVRGGIPERIQFLEAIGGTWYNLPRHTERVVTVRKILVVLVLPIMALLLVACSGVSQEDYDTLEAEYTALKDDHASLQAEYDALILETEPEPTTPTTPVVYTKQITFDTRHIADAMVKLGAGDKFEARMTIRSSGNPGALVFYVRNSVGRVLDAGRIEGVYEFSFIADRSDDYHLVFIDDEMKCIVAIEYNGPDNWWDASVSYSR